MDTSLATSFVSQSGIVINVNNSNFASQPGVVINVSNPNDVCYFDNKDIERSIKNNKLEKIL